MPTTIETKNMHGATGKKEIFDQGVMKLILMTLDRAAQIKQTQDGDIEEYVALDGEGKELVRIRENYAKGRSTIHFDGHTYTKVDRHFFNGEINHTYTDAESSLSANTVNEKDFAELYGIMASRAR
jgi:hypothetical protein